ncbi:PAS domain-containing protein [Pararcticibacter amylolyticus]|uniref:histidine kinase n=1 Tax=Pararcticibacter amylolyticus TaxID=2173175 RepID=A0A2U2PGL1_9SPHI|nr:PAS domain-containing protein [Pararcticibacter amylolyticus]PWG80523.1 hypothetical protein DDR33_10825 [Pararcticibacter amylolyticus]
MHHIKDPLFYAVFNQLPETRLITTADAPQFTVIACNEANTALLGIKEELSGRSLWSLSYPDAFGGDRRSLELAVEEVLQTRRRVSAAPFLQKDSGSAESARWLQIEVSPVTQQDKVIYLIFTVYDRTQAVDSQAELQELRTNEVQLLEEQQALNDELTATNEELTAINEDLNESRETLILLNQQLEDRVVARTRELFLSEQKANLLIKDAPVGICLLTGEDLVIESANKMILDFWGKTRSVIGLPLLTALPELEGQPFPQLMRDVLVSGKPYIAYEAKAVLPSGRGSNPRYYNFVYHPLQDETGATVGIMVVASDVSPQVAAKKNLEASEFRLKRMVMTTPFALAILKTRDLFIEVANQRMLEIWMRKEEDVLGKPLMAVFPELEDQPFPLLLAEVFDTGKRVSMPEVSALIVSPEGEINEHYVDFSYDPLFDLEGNVEAILVSVSDITEIIRARQQLQERQEELEALNEEVTTGNDELIAINEELTASNEELLQAEQQLQVLYNKLAEREDLFRGIFEQAPLGMCVLRGPEHITEQANDNILKIWGRTSSEILNIPHRIARPELAGQPFNDWLDEVYSTGIARVNSELHVRLYAGPGRTREAYVNSLYQPLRDAKGSVYGILVILEEVTERVYERKKTEHAQEQFRLAVESAALGTWSLTADSREFTLSPRLKELYGFSPDEHVSVDSAMAIVSDEYRQKLIDATNDAIASGGGIDLEYTINRFNDGKLRWVKTTGKMYPADGGRRSHFSGTVQDITERKLEETRKNDFIAMASHELKTPLTSIKAYVQMLVSKAKNSDDDFSGLALAKVELQIKKMQSLISGFLDVARMESGRLTLNQETFLLDHLVKEIVAEILPVSPNHQLIIEQIDDTEINADRYKIGQVIDNLLRNAIKYSPNGGNIYIRCSCNNESALVSVRDEGMGITEQDMQGLFSRFYRIENPHTAHISGFGVGLYICAEIIRRHNGNIWVESSPGKGSTFFFNLPFNP